MSLSTQPYKGARDFYPEDKRIQKYMFGKIREVCESFGYQEYDAPILEPTEIYASKTSDEIVNEQTYTFEDRGGRSVTIRTEMTPSVSRMVAARRQELAYPARWYSIPNLWRYERPQRGRLREFWQLNVDLFGVSGIEGDFEMVQIVDAILKNYGAKSSMYDIKLNSRKFVDYLLQVYLGLDQERARAVIRLTDRMQKMETSEFELQLQALVGDDKASQLINVLKAKSLEDMPDELKSNESLANLLKLEAMLKEVGITNTPIDLTLMRGFDYYTDIVFEVFDTDPENNRSMFGGGRYDGLVGLFGVEPVSSVGFAMGDVPLQNFLESHQLLPELVSEVQVYVVLIGDVLIQAQKPIAILREEGVKVAVDVTGRKLDKQIQSAEKQGVPYVLFVGDRELQEQQYKLKELKSGTEQSLSIERVVQTVLDERSE